MRCSSGAASPSSPKSLWQQWQTLLYLAQALGLEAKADGDTDAATGELDEGCDRNPHPAASNGSTTARLYNGR